jgi:putative ABC transport system permease protein
VFTIPTAQKLFDRQGKLDAISVAAKPGISQEALAGEIRDALPATVTVRTATAQAKEDLKQVSFTKIIRYFLLSFGAIALFVGAFVIFNTLSITVAQRIREFATLRTIGASRRQLLTSVTLEALVIGVLASLLGLVGGLLLARGVNALFKASNNDLPDLNPSAKTADPLTVGRRRRRRNLPAMRGRIASDAAVREGRRCRQVGSRSTRRSSRWSSSSVRPSPTALARDVDRIACSLAVGCLFLFIGVALVRRASCRNPRVACGRCAGVRRVPLRSSDPTALARPGGLRSRPGPEAR